MKHFPFFDHYHSNYFRIFHIYYFRNLIRHLWSCIFVIDNRLLTETIINFFSLS